MKVAWPQQDEIYLAVIQDSFLYARRVTKLVQDHSTAITVMLCENVVEESARNRYSHSLEYVRMHIVIPACQNIKKAKAARGLASPEKSRYE